MNSKLLLTSGLFCDISYSLEMKGSRCNVSPKARVDHVKGRGEGSWVVDYVDQGGKRRLKTFAKKKAADNFEATANVEVRAGIHTADSASITVKEAGKLWLETCEKAGLERTTIDAYRQHLRLHIEPYLGTRSYRSSPRRWSASSRTT